MKTRRFRRAGALAGALTLSLLLTSCDFSLPFSLPFSFGKKAEETEATSGEMVDVSDIDPYELSYNIYDLIVETVREAAADGWTGITPASLGLPEALAEEGARPGYLIEDLDGDRVKELVIGLTEEDGSVRILHLMTAGENGLTEVLFESSSGEYLTAYAGNRFALTEETTAEETETAEETTEETADPALLESYLAALSSAAEEGDEEAKADLEEYESMSAAEESAAAEAEETEEEYTVYVLKKGSLQGIRKLKKNAKVRELTLTDFD